MNYCLKKFVLYGVWSIAIKKLSPNYKIHVALKLVSTHPLMMHRARHPGQIIGIDLLIAHRRILTKIARRDTRLVCLRPHGTLVTIHMIVVGNAVVHPLAPLPLALVLNAHVRQLIIQKARRPPLTRRVGHLHVQVHEQVRLTTHPHLTLMKLFERSRK